MNYRLLRHAQEQMAERGITTEEVDAVLQNPQQIVPARKGRKAYQSLIVRENRIMLLRIFVDDQKDPAIVFSVYATTKGKYWGQP